MPEKKIAQDIVSELGTTQLGTTNLIVAEKGVGGEGSGERRTGG